MSAPALVVVVKGSRDPRVAQVAHALCEQLSTRRAEIDTHVAFLTSCPPSGMQVVSQFAALPGREIVYVPLDLARAVDPDESVAALLRRSRATHPDLRFALSRPVGPEPALLTVLDARLRAALAHARCLELDGLVLS
ncbi:MAG: CbiX/SirB N-terminal domain-containing protein, partial [Propionibacteriaceae bacterium]|nr:CbiX/SirB N-terminal domain-containing protein [Propionibacteriaceae bacterium]